MKYKAMKKTKGCCKLDVIVVDDDVVVDVVTVVVVVETVLVPYVGKRLKLM